MIAILWSHAVCLLVCKMIKFLLLRIRYDNFYIEKCRNIDKKLSATTLKIINLKISEERSIFRVFFFQYCIKIISEKINR